MACIFKIGCTTRSKYAEDHQFCSAWSLCQAVHVGQMRRTGCLRQSDDHTRHKQHNYYRQPQLSLATTRRDRIGNTPQRAIGHHNPHNIRRDTTKPRKRQPGPRNNNYPKPNQQKRRDHRNQPRTARQRARILTTKRKLPPRRAKKQRDLKRRNKARQKSEYNRCPNQHRNIRLPLTTGEQTTPPHVYIEKKVPRAGIEPTSNP